MEYQINIYDDKTGYLTVSPEMKYMNCNDILHEKNGGICRDACDAHIPTDIPLHL
jgi:hypothetical protein